MCITTFIVRIMDAATYFPGDGGQGWLGFYESFSIQNTVCDTASLEQFGQFLDLS